MPSSRYTYPFYAQPGRPSQPQLRIRFTNPDSKQSFTWDCLIDTGADSCLLPKSIVNLTGHDLKASDVQKVVTMGVEGTGQIIYRHTFVMELLHPTESKAVWKSPVMLVDCADHDSFPPLLGQSNFLSHFKITIDYQSEMTTVEWA